jgi:hypothetical protein
VHRAQSSRHPALEVAQVLARGGHRLRLVVDQHIDHAVGVLHRRLGPICSGRNTPSPPPSIMAGPPMPMLLRAWR